MNATAMVPERSDDGRLAQLTARARELAAEVSGPLRRVSVQLDGAGIELEWEQGVAAPAVGPPPGASVLSAVPDGDPPADEESAAGVVRSPVVGTFYSCPAPGEPPFVTPGGTVGPDTVVGIVEAMKLMNHIVAGQDGQVRSVLPDDGSPVDFDQALVLLDPVQPVQGEGRS